MPLTKSSTGWIFNPYEGCCCEFSGSNLKEFEKWGYSQDEFCLSFRNRGEMIRHRFVARHEFQMFQNTLALIASYKD